MKTSLTLVGFLLFFTGAILCMSWLFFLLLDQAYAVGFIALALGVVTLMSGKTILNKCATLHWRGSRRPHTTHKLAR